MNSRQEEATMETTLNRNDESMTLVPLSRAPILLVSSQPLLTMDECNMLRRHFEKEYSQEGEFLLERVRKQIDRLTGCPSHDGEAPLPRYLSYTPQASDPLFPDGLHVDTNNGKHFRHITALLYLTTNDNGATTFPLAWKGERTNRVMSEVVNAAQTLLDSNVTHTFDESQSEENRKLSMSLERAGEQLYKEESGDEYMGLRVLPSAGMLCVFSNVLENGQPDPLSFHGGEAGNDDEKVLLTIFKEIPLELFSSREEFGRRVAEKRRYLLERYYAKGNQ
jgi:hypothetical protein